MATEYGTARAKLEASAREVFAERGYRGATTRDIAGRSGVSEPMLFRHFGSKEALFEQAVVDPVVAFMDGYVAEWAQRPHGEEDATLELRHFLDRLYAVMNEDRALWIAALAAVEFDGDLEAIGARLRDALGKILSLFEGLVEEEFALRSLHTPDREAFARLMLATTLGLSLHGPLLGVGPDGIGADRLLAEASRVTLFGVSHRGN